MCRQINYLNNMGDDVVSLGLGLQYVRRIISISSHKLFIQSISRLTCSSSVSCAHCSSEGVNVVSSFEFCETFSTIMVVG